MFWRDMNGQPPGDPVKCNRCETILRAKRVRNLDTDQNACAGYRSDLPAAAPSGRGGPRGLPLAAQGDMP